MPTSDQTIPKSPEIFKIWKTGWFLCHVDVMNSAEACVYKDIAPAGIDPFNIGAMLGRLCFGLLHLPRKRLVSLDIFTFAQII